MGYDGVLKFDTKVDTKEFNKSCNNIESKFAGISTALKAVGTAIVTAFSVTAIKNCIDEAEKLQNAMTGLKSIMDGQGKSYSQATKFIKEYTEDGLIPQTEAVTAYKNLSLRGYNTEQIEKVMTALKDAATYSRQSSYSLGEAVASAAEGLKNENSILVDNAGVTKNVAKMWDDYAKSIGKTSNNLTQQEKIQAEVNGILEETKFQTGDSLTYANSYSGMIARLNASFITLKQTLGGAFMQIFQSILPIIQTIINALNKLATAFANIVSLIFNKQVNVNNNLEKSSKNATTAIVKQGNAAEKAGEQAEGALLSFDRLNVLNQETGSSNSDVSGSSLETLDPVGELELGNNVTISPKLKEAFDKICEMFDDLKEWTITNYAPIFQDIYDNFILPVFEGLLTNVLPFAISFISTILELFGKLVDELTKLFQKLYFEGISPNLERISNVWNEIWKSIYENWEEYGKPVFQKLEEAIENVSSIFQKAWDEIINPVLDEVGKNFDKVWDETLEPFFDDVQKAIYNTIDAITTIYNNVIAPIVKTLIDVFGPDLASSFKFIFDVFSDVFTSIVSIIRMAINVFSGLMTFISGVFSEDWEKAWRGIKDIFNSVINGITGIFKGVINALIDTINYILRNVSNTVNKVLKGINAVTGAVGIKSIPLTVAYQIPKLATGAVIPPNAEFMAVLGDQKNGRNLEAPEDLIRQIVREESGKCSSVIAKVYLDKREIAKAVAEVNDEIDNTQGNYDIGGGSFVY